MSLVERIHGQAMEISSRYKRAEADLVEIIQQVEAHRVFLSRGHSSVFRYVTSELRLGENLTYSLITVARKARDVPELKMQLQAGAMTLTNARRVAAVLTPENQKEWIKSACELSSRELEKEVARVRPGVATPERASYVTHDRVKLEVGLSECEMLRLRRAQDLLCQSKKRPVSLEETIGVVTGEFLRRHDPVEKAKRHQVKKGGLPSESVEKLVARRESGGREPIPAVVLHQVNLRDQRRCTHALPDGSRCNESRWTEIHHKVLVSEGGTNAPDNLTTLCSSHHRRRHLNPIKSRHSF
jgi:hypothetical protein